MFGDFFLLERENAPPIRAERLRAVPGSIRRDASMLATASSSRR